MYPFCWTWLLVNKRELGGTEVSFITFGACVSLRGNSKLGLKLIFEALHLNFFCFNPYTGIQLESTQSQRAADVGG